jgi:hypothetical protein
MTHSQASLHNQKSCTVTSSLVRPAFDQLNESDNASRSGSKEEFGLNSFALGKESAGGGRDDVNTQVERHPAAATSSMTECTRNGGGGPITQLAHDRWRISEAERTSTLGVYHNLASARELVNAVLVLAAEIHERPFAIRLNLGE